MAVNWIPKRLVEISLINIAAKTGKAFVETCEADYYARIEAAAQEILQSKRRIVMLTGPSSSGKTTTAHKLEAALEARGTQAAVISLDDFFLNIDEYPRLPDGSKDYENITALDIPRVNSCLAQVVENGVTEIPQFDFMTESRKSAGLPVDVGGGVLIVEGIHAHNPLLTEKVPAHQVFRLYAGLREEYSFDGQRVLATRDVRLARRMVRDHQFRGHSPVKTIAMWAGVCAGEDKYIKVFKPQADYLLDTSFSYEINCLAPAVAKLAQEFCDGTSVTKPLAVLNSWFSKCDILPLDLMPQDSMLREFLGTSNE